MTFIKVFNKTVKKNTLKWMQMYFLLLWRFQILIFLLFLFGEKHSVKPVSNKPFIFIINMVLTLSANKQNHTFEFTSFIWLINLSWVSLENGVPRQDPIKNMLFY